MSTPKKSTTQKAAEEEVKAKVAKKAAKAEPVEAVEEAEEAHVAKVLKGSQTLANIAIENISIKPGFNPRTDLGDYAVLKSQIKKAGILQPIVLCPTKPNASTYFVVAGHRRFTIAQELGLQAVPSNIRTELDIKSDEAKGLSVMENNEEGRSNLSEMDQAASFKFLLKSAEKQGIEEGARFKRVAELTGYSLTYVKRQMKLTDLNDDVKTLLKDKAISKRTALAVAEVPEEIRERVASKITASTTEDDVRRIRRDVAAETRATAATNKDGKVSKHNRAIGNAPGTVAIAPTVKQVRQQISVVGANLLNATEFDAKDKRVGPNAGEEEAWAAYSNQLAALLWTLGSIPEISVESAEYSAALDDIQERLAADSVEEAPAAEPEEVKVEEEAEEEAPAPKKAKKSKKAAAASDDEDA